MIKNLSYLLLFFAAFILTSQVEAKEHRTCKKNKTLFSVTYQNLTGLSISGSGSVSQEIANITQGTKIIDDPISFNSGTTTIDFPNPVLQISAVEGDTVFVNLAFSLNPGSSVVSSQPIIIMTSDTKNFSTPQTNSLLSPGITLSNTASVVVGTDLFDFFTVFPALGEPVCHR